jgi:alkylation response protein AidB-like acyl-CoA dehydrogenase
VFAKTDPDAGHRGISAFVVERDTPGLTIGEPEQKMGMRGSPTCELYFDDAVVPAANLIGKEGEGFSYAMGALDSSRPLIGIQALGIAQGALDAAVQYVVERRQFGQRIADFQGVQFMLADMATQVEAARLLVYEACTLLDAGDPRVSRAAAMSKLFAADTAMRVTTDAVQLFGGAGYTRRYPVERMMRDAKVTQIYEGTNQVQRIVVARHLLDGVR